MTLQIEGLTKRFGAHTLFRGLELRVEGPAVLWAPSGWGKTTLLRILMGLERSDAGSVTGVGRVIRRPIRNATPSMMMSRIAR